MTTDEQAKVPAEPQRTAHVDHVPALDGLRALAVLAVITFHAGTPFLRGGFIGVDVFFVISGFLITGILLDQVARTGRVGLGRFYMRRLLRLGPALLLLLVVYLALSPLLTNRTFAQHAGDALVTLLYSQNWTRAIGWHEPRYLAHTWSLSIEEQFYLVWPVAIGLVARWRRPALTARAIGALCLVAFAYPAAASSRLPWERLYLGTDMHSGPLLLGAALAALTPRDAAQRLDARSARTLGYVGLAAFTALALFAAYGAHDRPYFYLWGLALVSVCSAALIAGVVLAPASPMGRALSWGWLRWVGRISYGLYLWHFPIYGALFFFGARGWPLLLAGSLLGSLVAATASYYLVELPFLRRKAAWS